VFKGIKRALGAASAEDYYEHALAELEQERTEGALQAFDRAAKKAAEEGKEPLRHRASAAAALHLFIASGDLSALSAMSPHLGRAGWVERPGERADRVPADLLAAEVEGRLAAAQAEEAPLDLRADLHEAAADAFGRCLDLRLVTYAYHHDGDPHVRTGRSRHHFHSGLAAFFSSRVLLGSDPQAAGNLLSRALASFAGCEDEGWQERCAESLRRMQTRRTCWMCHREYPGEGDYYTAVPAYLTPFILDAAARDGHDTSSMDLDRQRVVLCRVCRSLMDARVEQEVRSRVAPIEARLTARLDEVTETLEQLATAVARR
jgi:hypothetical protein